MRPAGTKPAIPQVANIPPTQKEYIEQYMENHMYDPIEYPVYDWKSRLLQIDRTPAPSTM